MKKAVISLLTAAVLCVGQAPIARAETIQPTIKPILISELQTGGAHDATEEFVELYNPNETAVDITGWQLQYRAASGTNQQTWPNSSTKATLACPTGSPSGCTVRIEPLGRLVLVHTLANIVGALPMSGGFSATGGEIRLLSPGATPIVEDFVGYGTAADSETSPAPAPSPGKSIKRVIDADENIIDTNNNAADFAADCGNPSPGIADDTPLPYFTGCAAPQTAPADTTQTDPPSDPDPTSTDDQPTPDPTPLTYLPMLVTEVFPDPATPQQDSSDEFIELYNPNDTAVSLTGYALQTGADWRYHYTLGDTPLGPHDYFAVRSAVSKLSLSNSGSGVRLIDPNGQIAFEVPTYGDAKEGQAWMFDAGSWQWTLTPTPSTPNILTVPVPKPAALTTGTVPHKTTTKAKPAPKAPAKLAAPKLPKATKTAAAAPNVSKNAAAATPQYWLLLPIGLIAGGYAVYEYRTDISRAGRTVWARLNGKRSEQKLLGDNSKDFV